MKIKKVTIKNFRSYKDETSIYFDDLTAFVGHNDSGKSSILEALDIFFNEGKGTVKLDGDDINRQNKENGNCDIVITVSFTELPERIVIDSSNETTLADEYLLDSEGCLQIRKTFKNGRINPTDIKISIIADHPHNPECSDLLQKKQKDLTNQLDELNIHRPSAKKAEMRAAIWNHYRERGDLQIREGEVAITSQESDAKSIWDKLQTYLPSYSLFQADRKNSESDSEIQDPLKVAVKDILKEVGLSEQLSQIASQVQKRLDKVAKLTCEKLRDINPEIANSLHPNINFENLRWFDVFKHISISGDNDIPINKRGSGVRRLVLISFFRAEAERRQNEQNNSGIIYAIEEPETSQHAEHQQKLMDALLKLAQQANTQIIITTHNANIVKELDFENIRLITTNEHGEKEIKNVEPQILPDKSLNEVSYLAFGEISESYHDELYGYLQMKAADEDKKYWHEKDFDTWLQNKGCPQKESWIRIKEGKEQNPEPRTLQTYIRNSIHHPENRLNKKRFNADDLKASIEQMIEIAKTFQN